MLREVHVERIIVLEPIRGEHLVIPLRFVESYAVGLHFFRAATRL